MPIIQASEVVNGGIVRPVPTTARFDSMLISPHIQSAELKFLKPALCADFYNDLIAEKNATPSNYNPDVGPIVLAYPTNADYELLWTSYLMALDSYAVLYIALPHIAVQTGTNGLYFNDSQFGEKAGTRGAKYLQDSILENHIDPLRDDMLNFLCDNAANYPLFPVDIKCKSCSCSCENGKCQDLTTCRKKGPISKKLGIFLY